MIPGGRMAEPGELKGVCIMKCFCCSLLTMGQLYVFLASDASGYITGANIIIDGALSIP
jgi:NAD(P)-dependent dehydrogenase (short-subunit alcohol dehydrogenase family)